MPPSYCPHTFANPIRLVEKRDFLLQTVLPTVFFFLCHLTPPIVSKVSGFSGGLHHHEHYRVDNKDCLQDGALPFFKLDKCFGLALATILHDVSQNPRGKCPRDVGVSHGQDGGEVLQAQGRFRAPAWTAVTRSPSRLLWPIAVIRGSLFPPRDP